MTSLKRQLSIYRNTVVTFPPFMTEEMFSGLRTSCRHGEPSPACRWRLAVGEERLERQRELQGELAVLDAGAGSGPLGPAAGQDEEEDGGRRSLVLAGVLPPAHGQRGGQPHLQVSSRTFSCLHREVVLVLVWYQTVN